MAINFIGSRYDERVNGDLRNSTTSPNYVFGKNVTIVGFVGSADPDRYYTANPDQYWQDSAAFDITTTIQSGDTQHPNGLLPGKTYDVAVTMYNFATANVKFEENNAVLRQIGASDWSEYTFSYVYTPTNASSFFNVAIKLIGSTSDYKITLTERVSSTNPPTTNPPSSAPAPDLSGTLISLKSDIAESESAITIRYDLSNQGTAAASNAGFAVFLSKDPTITTSDIYLGKIGGINIASGETRAYETTTIPLPAGLGSGQYFVGVIADHDNLVKESNENNNTSTSVLPIFVKPNLDVAVRDVYRNMYKGDVSGDAAEILENFADAQYNYGRQIGVYSPYVYANEALGLALAERAGNGSNVFGQTYGPATLTSMQLYTQKAYQDVFGRNPTSEQSQHFLKQVEYFEKLYEQSGAFGNDQARLDQLARGAVFGQMVGIKAEANAPTIAKLEYYNFDLI